VGGEGRGSSELVEEEGGLEGQVAGISDSVFSVVGGERFSGWGGCGRGMGRRAVY
jgi:hypothetical protein